MTSEIRTAAGLIRAGELVAFPTETVYGLGANALDPKAVAKIFALKGRPTSSPLIVHVSSIEMARMLVTEWPAEAELLAQRYWAGPLTMVLPKASNVPDLVTAGLPSVGIRMPHHPVALALIEASGVPIAAPSANRFMELSPTTAAHVRESFPGSLVLDGGPSRVGIESTVISIRRKAGETRCEITLLRPGMISIEEILRAVAADAGESASPHTSLHASSHEAEHEFASESSLTSPHATSIDPLQAMPSPGMHPRHYSPRTPLLLIGHPCELPNRLGIYLWRKKPGYTSGSLRMPFKPDAYAARLYDALHQADAGNWPWIAVEMPPDTQAWSAILDRLHRAATK